MKITLDLKSAAIGLCGGLLIMFTIGAGDEPVKPVGRFQITSTGNPAMAMVVDTITGRVWGTCGTAPQLRNDGDFFAPKAP